MPNIFITGDKHGDYASVEHFCRRFNTTKEDVMVILGDNGVNYYGPSKDKRLKKSFRLCPSLLL